MLACRETRSIFGVCFTIVRQRRHAAKTCRDTDSKTCCCSSGPVTIGRCWTHHTRTIKNDCVAAFHAVLHGLSLDALSGVDVSCHTKGSEVQVPCQVPKKFQVKVETTPRPQPPSTHRRIRAGREVCVAHCDFGWELTSAVQVLAGRPRGHRRMGAGHRIDRWRKSCVC